MRIEDYLTRIGVEGPLDPDISTLRKLHRAHLLTVPYENLDVQLGRPVTTDQAAAYDKIVVRGRGGWCYEMNGLFGWALEQLGYRVTRISAGNTRGGPRQPGTHLILKVDLDTPWIADVGFGDGPIEPYPLNHGPFGQEGFNFRLEPVEEPWIRFHNHETGMSPSYDFVGQEPEEALLAETCGWLQSAPQSPFVMNAVVLRHTPGGRVTLIGRKLRTVRPDGQSSRLIADADDYVSALKAVFDLDLPEAATLWPKICARHEEILATKPA